jgi:hypothetical protein
MEGLPDADRSLLGSRSRCPKTHDHEEDSHRDRKERQGADGYCSTIDLVRIGPCLVRGVVSKNFVHEEDLTEIANEWTATDRRVTNQIPSLRPLHC